RLPDAVVCYTDSTSGLPLLAAYALATHAPRAPKRLLKRRAEMLDRLKAEYSKSVRNEAVRERARHGEDHDVTLEPHRRPLRSSAASAAPAPLSLTQRRGVIGSRGDAENAEVLRAQRVGSGSLALRRLRGVLRDPDMWLFAPGGSAFAGWSRPRPAPSPAG